MLLAQIPEDEAGSARFGNRDIQVNYFIAQAYSAIGNKKESDNFYNKATSDEGENVSGIMDYYRGLSHLELKEKSKAKAIFKMMLEDGNKVLAEESNQEDFFAIFGAGDDEKVRKSMAYTMRGFGNAGLGKSEEAKVDLNVAIDLLERNLWAKTELDRMMSHGN